MALLRRLYEVTVILAALWREPARTEEEMRRALERPYTDDRYAQLAEAGVIGAVMPSIGRLKQIADLDSDALTEVEVGLKSVGHGGIFASGFYVASGPNGIGLTERTAAAKAFMEVSERCALLASAGASMIAQRLGFEGTYRFVDEILAYPVVEAREDAAMDAFEEFFPTAPSVIWATCMGLHSIASELGAAIGSRPYDPLRRQVHVIVDGVASADLTFEMLHRGRLSAAATACRRLLELALEAAAWAVRPEMLAARFGNDPDPMRDRSAFTPAATTLIAELYSPEVGRLQRQTYSTLCSVAHGGLQAHEYLLLDLGTVQPAPAFIDRHHRWMLGTLASSLDALLQSALIIAGRVDPEIERGHLGYRHLFSGWLEDMPVLGLVPQAGNEPADGSSRAMMPPDA